MAKLTDDQALEIRKRYLGGETQQELSEQFGSSRVTIEAACWGERGYRHLPPTPEQRKKLEFRAGTGGGARVDPEIIAAIEDAYEQSKNLPPYFSLTVKKLAEHLGSNSSTVSYHLHRLRKERRELDS